MKGDPIMVVGPERTLFCALIVGLIACTSGSNGDANSLQSATVEAVSQPRMVDSGSLDPDRGLCASLCSKSQPLKCPAASACIARCERMRAEAVCRDESQAALRCFASTPANAWECNAHGLPSVKDGQCNAEQARVADCLRSGLRSQVR
jgi:hypothetical protein